jgi:hypothetical protein
MGARAAVETRHDRKALVADAGFGELSFVSAAAGVVAAYGLFALLAGLATGVLAASKAKFNLSQNWHQLGMAGGLVVAGLLLLAYLFGGYVAGRMARRAGVVHGVVVFVLGVVVVALAAVIARAVGGADVASSNLRGLGVPTTGAEWRDVATVAGVASLVAMLVGAVAGGALGERWHAKLVTRALDPRIGAEAEAVRQAELQAAEAEERRSGSFRRVRAATPSRTRRVDAEHLDTTQLNPRVAAAARAPEGDGNGHEGSGDEGHDGHTAENWAFWRRYGNERAQVDPERTAGRR